MKSKLFFPFSVISILFFIISCNHDQVDKELFNGEIYYINDKETINKEVIAKHISLEGNYSGSIAVYDSILICWNPSYQDYWLELFNINTGKEVGYSIPRGQGPYEFPNINMVYQLFEKDGNIMALFSGKESLVFWNLTQTIQTGKTVYDTIIPVHKELGLFFFHLPNECLLNVMSAQFTDIYQSSLPYCERFAIYKNSKVQKFPIYKQETIHNNQAVKPVGRFFNSWDALKPNGTKLVQAMGFLPQLNIIDTNTGQVVGYRMKNGPDYSLVYTKMKDLTRYYVSVQADDKYIYAVYWGKKSWGDRLGDPLPKFDQIHVFDWKGNLCYKLKTDQSFFQIWLDTTRNRLYTRDWNTDEIYYLDLKELAL